MPTYPLPDDEQSRLSILRDLGVLDTAPEPQFDQIVELASQIAGTPIALISLIDEHRQWFKASRGLDARETPRDVAFCAHAIMDDEVMIVEDALEDSRFADNPLVTGAPNIRFYAGAPLVTTSGYRIGTLCTIDRVARELDDEQKRALEILSAQVVTLLEMRRKIDSLQSEVLEQSHTERELVVVDQVTRAINEADTIDEALQKGIDAICDLTDWQAVDAWIPADELGRRFRRVIHRACNAPEDHASSIAEEDGLVRRAFESDKPLRIENTSREARARSLERADDPDLDHILAVPIGQDPRVAVVLFHLPDLPSSHARILDLVLAICQSLGLTGEKLLSRTALRMSEQQLRDLFDNATDLIQSVAPDGRVLFVNRAWLTTLGYEAAEVEALRIEDVVHPDSIDQWREISHRILEGDQVGEVELDFRTRTGARVPVSGNVNLRTERGIPVSTRAILRNVTIRKRFERALRTSEEQLRAILTNMLGGLLVLDEQGAIRQANPSAIRIFGYSEAELREMKIFDLVPDHVADQNVFLRKTLQDAIGKVTEWQGLRKGGDGFPFELSLFEFETTEGKFIAGNIRDISARREVDRLKSEFIATVSHELRTPLTSIRGSLGLLKSGRFGTLDDKGSRMLEIAERNSLRLLELINDILDFEKLESGKMDFEIQPAEITRIVQETIESIRGYARDHDVNIDCSGEEVMVRADAHRITQVLTNLLSNAVKFSDPGQTVVIRIEADATGCEVSVCDQGRGIPDHAKPMIFRRFSQVDAGDSKAKGGTGLGLAISKAIIDRHGGVIGFESREGKGSRFWFRLQRAK